LGERRMTELSSREVEYIRRHHSKAAEDNQCASALVKHIRAPLPLVIPFASLSN